MTRINCVPVEELTVRHLVAEYRELPRAFKLIRAAEARGEAPDDPRNPRAYTLGTGHVRFFYDKVLWLLERQRLLVAEMRRRGYQPQFDASPEELLPDGCEVGRWNYWTPDEAALALSRSRIAERLEGTRI